MARHNVDLRMRANAKIAIAIFPLLVLSGCKEESAEPSTAQRALDEVQAKYDELVKDTVEIPVDWAAEDLENIGDWEYQVVNLSFSSTTDLQAKLNEYGNERWEVIWFEKERDGFLVVLKKPSISYLSKIPLTQLGRLVIGGAGEPE